MGPNYPTEDITRPNISIVIPIYNEEEILEESVLFLIQKLDSLGFNYEIILSENGSKDKTRALAKELSEKFVQVRYLTYPKPNYGAALKFGIIKAKGEIIICDEIDLLDVDFYKRACSILKTKEVDMVVGSKLMPGAKDRRPWIRHLGTIVISWLLRVFLDFKGSDTHGLKAFKRLSVLPIVNECIVDKDLFASELVIRVARKGLNLIEIPVDVREKRKPSINLFKRVPAVFWRLFKLFFAIRLKRFKSLKVEPHSDLK
jgi:glycosyltransferase involved in cell wall biosynthesis